MDEILVYGCFFFNILFQNTAFMTAVPIHLIEHAFSKMFQINDGLQLVCRPRANKMHGRNTSIWFFFSIFYFKILLLWQQFPFIWLNMHLAKCFKLMMDFSWCVDLGPILRYLARKKSNNLILMREKRHWNGPLKYYCMLLNLLDIYIWLTVLKHYFYFLLCVLKIKMYITHDMM